MRNYSYNFNLFSLCLTAREKFWHVFQRTITENLYDEARHVFKTDKHGICATRHGRACRHVKLIPELRYNETFKHTYITFQLVSKIVSRCHT